MYDMRVYIIFDAESVGYIVNAHNAIDAVCDWAINRHSISDSYIKEILDIKHNFKDYEKVIFEINTILEKHYGSKIKNLEHLYFSPSVLFSLYDEEYKNYSN